MENNINPTNQPTNSLENNPIPPAPPKSNPLLVILLILFILLISAGAFALGKYFTENKSESILSPTPVVQRPSTFPTALPTTDPTASWKTYTNTKYKYSIKYPLDWTIEVEGNSDVNTFYAPYLKSPCNYEVGDRCGQIGVSTEEYDSSKKLDDYFRLNTTGSLLNSVINKVTTKLDTENAIDMEWFNNNFSSGKQNDQGAVFKTIKAIHINKVYSILTSEAGRGNPVILTSKDWKNKHLYDQILSTFHFLDDTQTTGTENWKTYTNTKYNYEFKYPENFVTLNENASTTRLMKNMGYIFEIVSNSTDKDLNQWLQDEKKKGQFPDKNWTSTNSTLNNLSAIYLHPNYMMQSPMDLYVIKKGNFIYTVSFEIPFDLNLYAQAEKAIYQKSNEEFIKNTKPVIDQILSTFKFID